MWNSHIPKKEKVFHFNSQQQKVQRFYILTVLIHLTIFVVIYLEQIFHTYEETRWLICTSRNWTLQLKLTFWVKMQVVSLWIPLLSLKLHPVSSKEFFHIQATVECRFSLKLVRGMIIRYSQMHCTDKYSQHSSKI